MALTTTTCLPTVVEIGLENEDGIFETRPLMERSQSSIPERAITYSRSAPSIVELDSMTWNSVYTGPLDNDITPASEPTQQSLEPLLLSNNAPLSQTFPVTHSWSSPPATKYRVLTCCLMFFANGMNDSAPGALIPHMETYYGISYATVSLIFVSQAGGFLLAAPVAALLMQKLGYANTYILAELCMVVGFAALACTPPYGVVIAAFGLIGWAEALSLTLSNVYCSNLAGSTVILGAAQGAYGLGGTIGPIIATSMAVGQGWVWSRYYLVTLVVCLFAALSAAIFFKGYEREIESEMDEDEGLTRPATTSGGTQANKPGSFASLIKALKYNTTYFGALFTFVYQGAEVTISGWTISFLITERGGDPARVGYVTAGFWGGITLGRFTLSPLAARLGERPTVFVLSFLAIAFQLLVWLVPNIIGESIAVALVGFVLGPLAPCSTVVFARLLPRNVQATALSVVSSAGSSGGALWPFLTGLLAQSKGTYVLHPICLGLFGVMVGSWLCVKNVDKRRE